MAKCPTSLSSSMRHRLTIQTVVRTPDAQGGFTEAWTDGATVWGSITTLKAFQRFQAMQMQTPETHKIVIRYRPEVTTSVRLKFEGRIFTVQEVVNVDQRNRYLEIKVNERA